MVHAQYMRYRTHRMPLLSTWWYSWWSLHQHLVESHSVRLLVNRFDSNILISEHVFKAPSQTYSSKSLLISSEQAARNFSRFIIIDIKHHFIARTGVKQHPFYNIPTGIDNHGGTPPPKESSIVSFLPKPLGRNGNFGPDLPGGGNWLFILPGEESFWLGNEICKFSLGEDIFEIWKCNNSLFLKHF